MATAPNEMMNPGWVRGMTRPLGTEFWIRTYGGSGGNIACGASLMQSAVVVVEESHELLVSGKGGEVNNHRLVVTRGSGC